MVYINWGTVVASIITSAITVQIIISINKRLLSKKLLKFQSYTIEACTDEVSRYVNTLFRNTNFHK